MKGRFIIALIAGAAAVILISTLLKSPSPDSRVTSQAPAPDSSSAPAREAFSRQSSSRAASLANPTPGRRKERTAVAEALEAAPEFVTSSNKLERLAQIRETFKALAAGDRTAAMRAAKELKDVNERETALLTLVTEWTQGNLTPAQQRARAIASLGLETGLGLELARDPELAKLWVQEFPGRPGQVAIMDATARELLATDPSAAFALGDQLPEDQRQEFRGAVFGAWARKDTSAALDWAGQLTDPAERDAAVASIRQVAPSGIGAAIGIEEGLPIIKDLIPGGASALSGQIHPGDRILALAQGDSSFLDTRNLPLQEIISMVRGDPGRSLQLKVLPANAPANTEPRIVTIVRQQVFFKN